MSAASRIRQTGLGGRRRHPLWRLLRANFYDLGLLLRESWIALTGFTVLVVAGTLYFMLLYSGPTTFTIPSAIYETLRLLSLQSGENLPADPIGQVLFFLIPLLGLALIFQSVLNFGRLLLDKGSRREAWQIALASTYRDHVIVCGLGRVSLRVVLQLLQSGYEVVVVELNPQSEFVDRVVALKVPVVIGDARELVALRQAGLMRARSLVSGISDDLQNIEVALAARQARPDIHVVLRVFNEDLDRNLERGLGTNSAFSASALGAPTFAAAAVSREVDVVLPIGHTLIGVSQLTIQSDSLVSGFVRKIEESQTVRVLHHADSRGRPIPRGTMRHLTGGDQVTVLGTLQGLEELRVKNVRDSKLGFLRPLPLQRPNEQFNTVIVCGLGKVGYRVVKQLHALNPRPRIVMIRRTVADTGFDHHIARLEGVTTIAGDARDIEVLRRAGLAEAYSVAALTSDDLLNLQIGLAARRERPDVHIVLRVFSDGLADRLADMFGIRTAYSTSALAGATMAASAVYPGVGYAFFAHGRLFSTSLVAVREGDALAGQTVDHLYTGHGTLVIDLCRSGEHTLLPPLNTTLAAGDEVTLLATVETLARLAAKG
ncbi:MAG: NAD-binding protein [Roseiflexaceae bacterium]